MPLRVLRKVCPGEFRNGSYLYTTSNFQRTAGYVGLVPCVNALLRNGYLNKEGGTAQREGWSTFFS